MKPEMEPVPWTIPTRADGGIDWDRTLSLVGIDRLPDELKETGRTALTEFGKVIAAHTRERCARYHDEQGRYWREQAETWPKDSASRIYAQDQEARNEHHAAAIRKLED